MIPHVSIDRYLGVASLAGARTPTAPENTNTNTNTNTCNNVPGLVVQQLQVCQRNPESLLCIKQGARLGIYECQSQFKYERWNCTTSKNYTVFGEVLRKGMYAYFKHIFIFQSCFIYSITSLLCPSMTLPPRLLPRYFQVQKSIFYIFFCIILPQFISIPLYNASV